MHSSFVFSYFRGTLLGTWAHWHSNHSLRRALASKSSALPVILRAWSKGKGRGPEKFPMLSTPEGPFCSQPWSPVEPNPRRPCYKLIKGKNIDSTLRWYGTTRKRRFRSPKTNRFENALRAWIFGDHAGALCWSFSNFECHGVFVWIGSFSKTLLVWTQILFYTIKRYVSKISGYVWAWPHYRCSED